MRRATITFTAAALIVTGFAISPSFAHNSRHSHSHSAHGGHSSNGNTGTRQQTRLLVGGYFSPRLGAQFAVEQVRIGGYSFIAARIVSQPVFGSPLHQLGLNVGDVITRLDGIRVRNSYELERHILQTKVRFVKAGSYYPQDGWMFIDRNRFFHDTFYPPYFPYASGGTGWTGGGIKP